jgi:Tfp pilus assembly protein PilV
MKAIKRKITGFENPNGYMLVEALISIAIFSVGFLAVAALVLLVSRNNTSGNQLTEANMLARERLEQLKSTSDISLLPAGPATFSDGPMDGRGNPGGPYTRTWTIQDALGFNTSREIKVTVNWTNRGRNRSVVLDTITKGNGT